MDERDLERPRGLDWTLTVTGDRHGTFRLTTASVQGQYALVGDDGRIVFEGPPAAVTQISYDGLEFFPDPGTCTITPGDLHSATGVGEAELRCDDLADIRGNGVITITGAISLPLDLLGESDLPPSGGSVEVGGEAWDFDEAILSALVGPALGGRDDYSMQLVDEERSAALNFAYDHDTHRLSLVNVMRAGSETDIPGGACELRETELGKPNPSTTVMELAISCASIDVPGLGAVPVSGTVVIERVDSLH